MVFSIKSRRNSSAIVRKKLVDWKGGLLWMGE